MRRAVNGDGANDSRRRRAGKHEIKYEFIIDSPKPGAGGRSILYVDGQEVAEGHNTEDPALRLFRRRGADVGMDGETATSNDYKQGDNKFTGKILKITINTKPSMLSASIRKMWKMPRMRRK